MRKFILLVFLLGCGFISAQQSAVVLDSLPVINSKDSYAVYLPKAYESQEKWPVIMIFDPAGRGAESLEYFKEAAETYGFVIAASNGVKNGTYQENLIIARSFYTEVLKQFSIDENAIYLAGFSGGARLAVSIAVMSSQIKGVIGSGASFANRPGYVPKENKFFYIGLVGDEDFNYREMHNAKGYLETKKFDTELLVFSGGHQWPSIQYINKAVRLLTLKSMNRNIIPVDQEKIQGYFQQELEFNKELLHKNYVYRAYEDMEINAANYRFYIEKDRLKNLKKEIRKNNQYRKQRNQHNRTSQIENYKYMDYLEYLPVDIQDGNLESMVYWEQQIDSISKDYIASPIRAKQKMGKRLLSFLNVLSTELGKSYNETEGLENLLYINILHTLIDEKDYDAYLNVLRYTVKMSDYGVSLYYLEKMLKNGFKDTGRLDKLQGIALLRIQPEYNALLEAYGLEARY